MESSPCRSVTMRIKWGRCGSWGIRMPICCYCLPATGMRSHRFTPIWPSIAGSRTGVRCFAKSATGYPLQPITGAGRWAAGIISGTGLRIGSSICRWVMQIRSIAGSGMSCHTGVWSIYYSPLPGCCLSGAGGRMVLWRQVEWHYNLKAHIAAHIEDTRLDTRRHDGVVKILEPAHVRLVVNVSQVGSFDEEL